MDINLNRALAGLLPWDLTLTVGGAELSARPPTLGDVAHAAAGDAAPGHDVGELAALVSRMLGGADPSALRLEQLLAVLHAVLEHWRRRSRENSQAIAPVVAAAVAAAKSSTPGSSTPP